MSTNVDYDVRQVDVQWMNIYGEVNVCNLNMQYVFWK